MFSRRSTSASLPSQSFWGKLKGKKQDKDTDYREKQAQMALARQRLLTLAYGDMETVRMVGLSSLNPALSGLSDLMFSAPSELQRQHLQVSPPHKSSSLPQELEVVARDWTKPPPDAIFSLRIPTEFASLHASVS